MGWVWRWIVCLVTELMMVYLMLQLVNRTSPGHELRTVQVSLSVFLNQILLISNLKVIRFALLWGWFYLSWLGVGLVGHWFNSRPGHFGLSLGKTVYSILPQSTQLQNGYLALIRQCLGLVRYMLTTTQEYPGKKVVSTLVDTRLYTNTLTFIYIYYIYIYIVWNETIITAGGGGG